MDDKETLFEQIREGLRNYQEQEQQFDEPYLKINEYGVNFSDNDMASITIGSGTTGTTGGYTYTNWTGNGANIAAPNVYISPNTWSTLDDLTISNQASGKITLKGDEADIDINGRSLMKTLDAIQERLSMLVPDVEMEAEWDDLRALREQYESKLQECREKSRAWKALKQGG